MLHDLLLFSPFMICLFWAVLHCLLDFRTNSFPATMVVTLTSMLFFMIDAYYSAIYSTPEVYIWFSLVYQLVAPALIPAAVFYLRRIRKEENYHTVQFLWVIIPTAMFSVTAFLMSLVGTDAIVEMTNDINTRGLTVLADYKGELVYRYYIWSELVLRSVIAAEMLFLIIYIVVVSFRRKYYISLIPRFLFKGGSIEVMHLQFCALVGIGIVYMFKMFFFKSYLDRNLWISAFMALYVAVAVMSFGFFALFGAKQSITIDDIRNLMRFNYNRKNKQQTIETMCAHLMEDADTETQRRLRAKIGVTSEVEAWEHGEAQNRPSLADAIFNVASDSWSENSLMARFVRLMKEEQIYLKPGLSLADVAERLGTNKTYISKMVNNTYNMGFPELLNILRVDYAEHYIVLNKNAKQDEIAEACGFFSASSFNNTFKRITGMTPKMWVAGVRNN